MSLGGAGEQEPSQLTWVEDDEFAVDGIEYACRPIDGLFESTGERFCLRKPPHLVRRYEHLLRERAPRSIVEVGIYEGGSTALFAQLARPNKLIGFDIEPARSGLEEMIRTRGLESVVRPHWEIDQADGARLREIVTAEVGDTPLDLVIDDASHELEPTRATFNALFPLLRPGGIYVIEDWAWAHGMIATGKWAELEPLTILVFELIMAAGHRPEAVERVDVDRPWAMVTRGPRELDRSFDVVEHCGERGRELLPAAGSEPPPSTRRGSLWPTVRSQLPRLRGGDDTR